MRLSPLVERVPGQDADAGEIHQVAQTLQVYEPLLLVALVYVCLTFLIEALFAFVERRGTPVRRSVG